MSAGVADILRAAFTGGVSFPTDDLHTWTYTPSGAGAFRVAATPEGMRFALGVSDGRWSFTLSWQDRRDYRRWMHRIERLERAARPRGQRGTGHHRPHRRA